MFELLVRLQDEIESKKYTIKDLKEMGEILKDLKTEEVKLKKVDDKVKCLSFGREKGQ